MAIKSRRIGEQVDRNTLGRIRVANNSGVDIAAGDIVSVVGSSTSGGHLLVELTDVSGVNVSLTGLKLVADHAIANGSTGIVVEWAIVEMDTSGLVVGNELCLDPANHGKVMLFSGTGAPPYAGQGTLSVYRRVVGQVLTVATKGRILLAPSKTWAPMTDD
tara:strand:+ start:726 stop:1208 length:483 start_codon:yes stop_codon:yes gene_type:complete